MLYEVITRFPQFIEAYGSAFCPKLDTKPYYEFPIFDGSEKDNEVVDKWLDGYGHIEKKISEYKEKSEYIAGRITSYNVCYTKLLRI